MTAMAVPVTLHRPRRFMPRVRLIHAALPDAEWSICMRTRLGEQVDASVIGEVEGGLAWQMCERCEARRSKLELGEAVGRRH